MPGFLVGKDVHCELEILMEEGIAKPTRLYKETELHQEHLASMSLASSGYSDHQQERRDNTEDEMIIQGITTED